ncbi:hypothetical protein pb186bvf_007208 [Paramecium bursaria]
MNLFHFQKDTTAVSSLILLQSVNLFFSCITYNVIAYNKKNIQSSDKDPYTSFL